jgi:trans-aconitate methyltransferase
MPNQGTEVRPPEATTTASAAPSTPDTTPNAAPQNPTVQSLAPTAPLTTPATAPVTAPVVDNVLDNEEDPIDTSSFYIFGDPKHDRDRLIAQARLFGEYVHGNAQRLLRTRPERILDIGCGEGQITTVFGKLYRSAKIIGVDIDPKAIEAAKLRLKRIPGVVPQNFEFETHDVQQTLPEGPFDLIYASLVFLHLADPEKTLNMCFEKLKPGGVLWIKEGGNFPGSDKHPVFNTWVEKTMNAMAKMGRKLMIVKELPSMLERAGFVDLRQFTENYEMRDNTPNGRIMISISLASTYNTIPMLSKLEGIPVEELKQMHETVRTEFEKTPIMSMLPNLIARKPLPDEKPVIAQ